MQSLLKDIFLGATGMAVGIAVLALVGGMMAVPAATAVWVYNTIVTIGCHQ